MERSKNCSFGDHPLKVHKVRLECDHKCCYKCFFKFLETNLEVQGFPLKCPNSECDYIFSHHFVSNVVENPEEMENLMRNLRLCSKCFEYKPKVSMTELCNHKVCENCKSKDKKCLKCQRRKFNESKNLGFEKTQISEKKEKKCSLCQNSKKSIKLKCCRKYFCKKCLRISFGGQLEKANSKKSKKIEKYDDTSDEMKKFINFNLKCPDCEEKIEENETITEILDEEQQSLYYSIKNFKKCRVCMLYKNPNEEILKMKVCHHKICINCYGEYLKISGYSKNLICPVQNCDCRFDAEQFINPKVQLFAETSKDNVKEIENFEYLGRDDVNELENFENYDFGEKPFEEEIKNIKTASKHIFCKICENEYDVIDIKKLLSCGHNFCVNCLGKYLKTKIGEGLVTETHLICPMEKCQKPINYYQIKEILPSGLFEKFDDLLNKHTIENPQNNEFVISCPNCKIDCIIDSKLSYRVFLRESKMSKKLEKSYWETMRKFTKK